MKIRTLLLALLVMAILPVPASAESKLPQEMVETWSHLVHDNMAGGMIGDGHIITEEEAAKLEYPLLPYELRERIIIIGHLSGFAKWCGLDWENGSFFPLMVNLRKAGTYNDYQLAFAGLLHGLAQANAERSKKDETCPEADRAKYEKKLIKSE